MFKIFAPTPTGPVAENVYALKDSMVNAFVYADGDQAIAVDAGNSGQAIRRALQQLPVDPAAVTHLFLTHSDRDHTGGLGCFPNAQVYLSKDEEQMIDGRTARFFGLTHNAGIGRPYILLADGEVVPIGAIRVRAITTPGHTPGSMSYLVNDRVLFTGDILALRDGRARPSFRLLNMDTAAQRESIRKLARLENIALLCTAHSGCTSDYARAMASWHGEE